MKLPRIDLRHGVAAPLFAFFDDDGPQRSAAVSFYAFLSLFPLAILTVVVFGLVVSDADARTRVIDSIMSVVPLREDRGREDLRRILEQVTAGATGFGVVGVVGLVVSASGAMGAVRHGLNAVFDVEESRPPLRGKAMDLALVGFAGVAIAASIAVTVLVQVASDLVGDVPGAAVLPVAGTMALGAGVLASLYRVVPNADVGWADVWPAALLTAGAFELLKWGFSLYVRNAGRYSAIYDSLAAVTAFLVFLYLAAALLLLGGEVAAQRLRRRQHAARALA